MCVVLTVIGAVVMFLRRPDVITSPKLWAEDGSVFMKDAYVLPVYRSIFTPYAGYVHVLLRLWATVTSSFPVRYVPLSYAMFAIVADTACLAVVLSKRFSWLIPSFAVRAVLFFSLILLPGTGEIHGDLTNSIWYMGLCLLFLSFATDPRTRAGKLGEGVACVLIAFTGATSVVVAPLFLLRWWRNRSGHSAVMAALVAAGGVFQFVDLRLHPRPPSQLASTTPVGWLRIMVERVGGTAALGQHRLTTWWLGPNHRTAALALGAAFLAGVVILGWWIPPKARIAFAVAMVLILGSITFGVIGSFQQFALPAIGGRYFVTPIALLCLALASSVPVAVRQRPNGAGWLALVPVVILATGIIGDARLPPLAKIDWPRDAQCIASHQPCHIDLDPAGWTVDLPPLRSVH